MTDFQRILPPPADRSSAEEEHLRNFAAFLLETNRHTNLTGTRDPEQLWERHVLDSLMLLPLLPTQGRWIDLGSGGGFPGIPLAILRPDLHLVLVESTGKKARFLEQAVVRAALPHVTVLADRSETLARNPAYREQFDLSTARALAPLPILIELALPFLRPGGVLLAMKGRRAAEEIEASDHALEELQGEITGFHLYQDSGGEEACVIEITKQAPCPADYPRGPGLPAQFPL